MLDSSLRTELCATQLLWIPVAAKCVLLCVVVSWYDHEKVL